MAKILGIDIGTQSVKCGLLDSETGALEHVCGRGYSSGALQPPEELWEATLAAVADTVARSGAAGEIRAVGLSGQMHGTVLYDADGEILCDVINWQDERGNAPREEYGGRTAVERMIKLMGGETPEELGVDRMASGFMGATLFCLMEQEQEFFGRVANSLPPTDFIRRRMTGGGPFATDPTNAFATGVYNTRDDRWHDEVIQKLGLPRDILPEVKPTDEVAGEICAAVAERTGLPAGTPVVVGGGDNQMAMIGSGAFGPGAPLCVNVGTSAQICAVTPDYKKIPGIDARSFIGGAFAQVYAGLTGGKSYTWLKNVLLHDLEATGDAAGRDDNLFVLLDRLAEDIPPGCNGLAFEPTLRGTRREPAKRAAFTGIGEENFSLGHRARAVMEGVVNELVSELKKMPPTGAEFIVGAGAGLVQSDIWRRIAANLFGMPIKVTNFENAVYGAALMAASGIGLMKPEEANIQYAWVVEPE